MPFTALHRLLGKDAGPITDALLDEAVAAELPETDDLDWKGELPPSRGLAETDFPKDVAAMANSGGGTIVYGVTEDEKRANGRVDIGDLSENHERALRAVAFSSISPPVFGLEILRIGEAGHRAVIVNVPPSSDAPHLIYRNQFFGAPLRNNADTDWMKERLIEAAYRSRLEGQRRAVEDLGAMWNEVSDSLAEETRARLIVVGRPRSPIVGSLKPTSSETEALLLTAHNYGRRLTNSKRYAGSHPLSSADFYNVRPGLRRWVALPSSSAISGRAATVEVHHEGSIALSSTVGGMRSGSESRHPDEVVESRDVEAAVADFMAVLRVFGEARGVREYDVQLGVEWAGDPLRMLTYDHEHFLHDPQKPLRSFVAVKRTVQIGLSDAEFHRQVHDLAEDAVNQGGVTTVITIIPPEIAKADE